MCLFYQKKNETSLNNCMICNDINKSQKYILMHDKDQSQNT